MDELLNELARVRTRLIAANKLLEPQLNKVRRETLFPEQRITFNLIDRQVEVFDEQIDLLGEILARQ